MEKRSRISIEATKYNVSLMVLIHIVQIPDGLNQNRPYVYTVVVTQNLSETTFHYRSLTSHTPLITLI